MYGGMYHVIQDEKIVGSYKHLNEAVSLGTLKCRNDGATIRIMTVVAEVHPPSPVVVYVP